MNLQNSHPALGWALVLLSELSCGWILYFSLKTSCRPLHPPLHKDSNLKLVPDSGVGWKKVPKNEMSLWLDSTRKAPDCLIGTANDLVLIQWIANNVQIFVNQLSKTGDEMLEDWCLSLFPCSSVYSWLAWQWQFRFMI